MESIEGGMGNLTIWRDLANLKNNKYFLIAPPLFLTPVPLMQNLHFESKTMYWDTAAYILAEGGKALMYL